MIKFSHFKGVGDSSMVNVWSVHSGTTLIMEPVSRFHLSAEHGMKMDSAFYAMVGINSRRDNALSPTSSHQIPFVLLLMGRRVWVVLREHTSMRGASVWK